MRLKWRRDWLRNTEGWEDSPGVLDWMDQKFCEYYRRNASPEEILELEMILQEEYELGCTVVGE